MDGWISIHRKIQEKVWYKDSEYVHVWIYLLLNANHKDKKIWINGHEFELKRGQLITSRKSISEKTGVTQSKIYRILKRYESEQQIEQQKTNKFTLITIKNYDMYQQSEQQNEQILNSKRTTNEQQMNTNNNDNNVNNIYTSSSRGTLFDFIEQNFGRTLNSVEYQTISTWEDNELTRYAISQAVLNNKFGIKYISAILESYKSENIRTVQEAQIREQNFKSKYENKKTIRKEPVPNWWNQDIKFKKATKEEIEELDELLKGF